MFLEIICAAFGCGFLFVGIHSMIYTKINKDECLRFVTFDWKEGRLIHRRMEKQKKCRISTAHFYMNLGNLVDEGLVELKTEPKKVYGVELTGYYYRLTKNGMRRIEDEDRAQEIALQVAPCPT